MSEVKVTKLHDDEVDIDASLVARLLAEQFPKWAGLPVRLVTSSGTDNVTFRAGAESGRPPPARRMGARSGGEGPDVVATPGP